MRKTLILLLIIPVSASAAYHSTPPLLHGNCNDGWGDSYDLDLKSGGMQEWRIWQSGQS
jgi:hypothetical protein